MTPAELKAVMERLANLAREENRAGRSTDAIARPVQAVWLDDLRSALTALEAQAWRPIESAPDDLRLFLGIDMRAPSPTVHFCTVKASHLSPPGSWYVTNGSSIQPTHWQPLPTPPVSEEQRS